jgi:hypothetical protein
MDAARRISEPEVRMVGDLTLPGLLCVYGGSFPSQVDRCLLIFRGVTGIPHFGHFSMSDTLS